MYEAISFVPLMLSTAGLAYASFTANKKNITWLIVAFIIWLVTFVWLIV